MDRSRRDGSFDLDSPGICLSAGNRAAMKALPAPEPERNQAIEPAEVWSPSMRTAPMPVAGEIAARSERYVCAACLQLGCPWGDVFGWVPYDERYRQRSEPRRGGGWDWDGTYLGIRRGLSPSYGGIRSYEQAPAWLAPARFVLEETPAWLAPPAPSPRRRMFSRPILGGCAHSRKRYRPSFGWRCSDCGEKVR